MEKKNERQKLKPSEVDFSVDFYGEKVKNAKLPNDTQYNFLLDRNQKYMENGLRTYTSNIQIILKINQ